MNNCAPTTTARPQQLRARLRARVVVTAGASRRRSVAQRRVVRPLKRAGQARKTKPIKKGGDWYKKTTRRAVT